MLVGAQHGSGIEPCRLPRQEPGSERAAGRDDGDGARGCDNIGRRNSKHLVLQQAADPDRAVEPDRDASSHDTSALPDKERDEKARIKSP